MCCGCLVLLIGGVFPRLAIFLLWILSDVLSQAFDSFWVGFLGFLLLPYTTLAFALIDYWQDGINGFGWLLVLLGFVFDIGSYTGGYARRDDVSRMTPG